MAERVLELRVPAEAAGQRADKALAACCADLSRSRLQRAFDGGGVTVDGRALDKRRKLAGGEHVRIVLDEPDADAALVPADLPLRVVYEDEAVVAVDKAPGMVTHPGSGTGPDTLVHALLHHCGGKLSPVGAPGRPGIVHRLDKETSGLIIAAKTEGAHHRLARAFSGRETFKRYLALVLGAPAKESGSCREPIGRHPVARTRMALVPSGREARTDWCVVERFGNRAALLSCVLHTGRTHQIRVHLSGMKHPLLGDTTYGFRASRLPGIQVPRVLLHAAELRLPHPERDEPLHLEAPPPDDFRDVIARLRAADL
jgi:23S rRNA pseudouridine1911/1915/1917 synthase